MKRGFVLSKLKPLAILVLVFFSLNLKAQEERLKTAFIYQLTRLIEWCPDGKQGNFIVGVVGNEPTLMAELAALQSRRVGTQQIEIVNFASIGDINPKSNILFVPDSQFDNIDQIASKVTGHCALIISDRPGSATRGAGVSLVYNQRASRLEFDIRRRYMRDNSLTVNDQLYNLATNVY